MTKPLSSPLPCRFPEGSGAPSRNAGRGPGGGGGGPGGGGRGRLRAALRALAVVLVAGVALALGAAPPPAAAAPPVCAGHDLIARLPADQRARLEAATRDVPFHRGLFWRARRGDQQIILVGTYHFDDPRHDAIMTRLGPEIDRADALLVEAGPDEEARLSRAITEDPGLIMDPSGPTLPERLAPGEWRRLADALAARGLPAVVASRMRPWYVSMMLGISPCMVGQVREGAMAGGLDHRLIRRAEGAGVPVRALEPWDTVFGLFRDMTPEQEIDMVRAALPAAEHADDYTATLTEAYFAGESWLIWEFGRLDALASSGLSAAEVDRQMQLAQDNLMDRRNRAWIQPLESAAAEAAGRGRGVVAGFGALHLPGRNGVLSLLQQRGWTISPLDGGPTGEDGDE